MALYPTSQLSAENVLRDVHDPVTQTLRTSATGSIVIPGGLEVNIDYTEDSVALGDPNSGNFASINSDGSVNVLIQPLSVPTILNISAPIANTEYTTTLPSFTKKFTIKCRNQSRLRLAFDVGESTTKFITIPPGSVFTQENINDSIPLFFNCSKAGEIVEILSWT